MIIHPDYRPVRITSH